MLDIIATSVLVGGVLYYIVKYKILFDTHRHTSTWNVLLSVLLSVIVTAYAIYIRVGESIDIQYITSAIIFAIGGTALDLISNIFPERGAWTAATALAFFVKRVYNILGSHSTEYRIGLGLCVTVICMILISEVYKLSVHTKVQTTSTTVNIQRQLPYYNNIAKLLNNGHYSIN